MISMLLVKLTIIIRIMISLLKAANLDEDELL